MIQVIDNIEKYFEERYQELIESNRGFEDLSLLSELVLTLLNHKEVGRPYILRIEEELIKRKLISQKIETWNDFISTRSYVTDIRTIQYYIYTAKEFKDYKG